MCTVVCGTAWFTCTGKQHFESALTAMSDLSFAGLHDVDLQAAQASFHSLSNVCDLPAAL